MQSSESSQDPRYSALQRALRQRGIFTTLQPLTAHRGSKLVCASDGGEWGIGGISFWITSLGGHWYLATWVPHVYSVPESVSIEDVVAAAITSSLEQHARNYYEVDPSVVAQYGLREIPFVEFSALVDQPGSA